MDELRQYRLGILNQDYEYGLSLSVDAYLENVSWFDGEKEQFVHSFMSDVAAITAAWLYRQDYH